MRPRTGMLIIAAALIAPTPLRAQAVPSAPRFSFSVGGTPGADGGGRGGLTTVGACVASCENRLSFWAIGAAAFRENGTDQFNGPTGLPVVVFRSERNFSLGMVGEYGVWGRPNTSRLSVLFGALLIGSNVNRSARVFVPGAFQTQPLPSGWRNDYGPLVGLQLERPAFGTRLMFSVRAEDTDRWRVPVSVGVRF